MPEGTPRAGILARLAQRFSFSAGSMLRTGSAAAVSQLIVLATMPIASRLFDEQSFGILGLMVGLANILVILNHLGYMDAIIASETEDEANSILRLVVILAVLGSVIGFAIVFTVIRLDLFGYGKLPYWAVFFVVAQAAAITLAFAGQQWLVRAEHYKALAGSHLVLGGGRGIGQVGLGLLLPTSFGLLCAELFSRLVTMLYVMRAAVGSGWRFHRGAGVGRGLVGKYAGFASLRAASIFLNAVNLALPAIIVARYFSLVEVGILSFALTLIYAPIGLIQKAIGDIFTGTYRAALQKNPIDGWRVFRQVGAMLAVMAAIVGVIAFTVGEPIFAFVFGAKWAPSGQTVEVLAPMIALMILVVPLSASLNILKRPDIAVYFNLLRIAGLGCLLFMAGNWRFDYMDTIWAISVVGIVAYICYGAAIFRINLRYVRQARDE